MNCICEYYVDLLFAPSTADPGARPQSEQFPFPPGSQVHGTTVCDALLPHSRPRPIFASSQESTVRGRCTSPRTSGQSRLGPREFGEDASERTTFCTIHPLLPFAAPPPVRRLCRWSCLHIVWRHGSRCSACLAGSRAQFDSAT